MKHKVTIIIIMIMLVMIFSTCTRQSDFPVLQGPYLGQKPPGDVPELFAYDLLSAGYHEIHRIFSPDGKEFIYTVFTPAGDLLIEPKGVFGTAFVMCSRMENGRWTEPEEFLYNRGYVIWYPSFSPDGKKLVFNSDGYSDTRPEELHGGIWYIEREADGWSKAREIDFGEDYEGSGTIYPSIAANGNLYFAQFPDGKNGFLYVSRYENGEYSLPEKLSDAINDIGGNHPYIAPDESYIIYDSERKDTDASNDIYISFRDKNSNWMKPQKFGDSVNSQYDERRPFLSYDEKYLFFTSDRINPEKPDRAITITQLQKLTNVPANSYQHTYWVDARIIEKLKPDRKK